MRASGKLSTIILAFVLFLFLVCGVLVVGGCYVAGQYNYVIGLDEGVQKDWAQVENQLQRRYDLIPNLVETVRGYATHEKELFENIANARTKYFAAGSRDERIEASAGIERALSRLLVLTETYPQLRAQESFLKLQDELAGTENRLSVERKRFNDAVAVLNRYRRSLLGQFVANWAGVRGAEYFEPPSEAREAPKVNFDRSAPAPAATQPQQPAPQP